MPLRRSRSWAGVLGQWWGLHVGCRNRQQRKHGGGTANSSATYSTTTNATLTIGGVSGTFSVTTFAAATTTYTGPSATGTGNVTASFTGSGAGCGYTAAQFIPLTGNPAEPRPAGTAPAGVTFPHGLFDFTTSGCTPGSTITMTITWPSTAACRHAVLEVRAPPPMPCRTGISAARRHRRKRGRPSASPMAALGDDDLLANGTIVNQGRTREAVGVVGASVPTLSEWAMMALALLLGFLGMRQAPQRLIRGRGRCSTSNLEHSEPESQFVHRFPADWCISKRTFHCGLSAPRP